MSDINNLIKNKLKEYPSDVELLAIKAIEFSETLSSDQVTIQLHQIARQLIKKKGEGNDTSSFNS